MLFYRVKRNFKSDACIIYFSFFMERCVIKNMLWQKSAIRFRKHMTAILSTKPSSKKLKTGVGKSFKLCEPPKSHVSLTKEKKNFLLSNLNKVNCLFLDYIIPNFEKLI